MNTTIPDEDYEIANEVSDLWGNESLGESALSGQQATPAHKAPSKTPSRGPSKEPSNISFSESNFGSDHPAPRPASKPVSKAASIARSNNSAEVSGALSQSHSRPASVAGGSRATTAPAGPGPGLAAGGSGAESSRHAPAGSLGRPASPLRTQGDDFGDSLLQSGEKSSASLPRGPPSVYGSGFGASGSARLPPPPASERYSPAASMGPGSGAHTPIAFSRPGSAIAGTSGFGGGSKGSFSRAGSLAPPEPTASPRASAAGFAGANRSGGGASDLNKSRRSQIHCHIPTPFELFRLYDNDLNGRVTHEEFFYMLRDLDGHPRHFAPQDDPEHRLVGLRDQRQQKDALLERRNEKVAAMETYSKQTTEEAKKEIEAEVEKLTQEVAELDAKIGEEEEAARQLVNHADPAVRVTPEMRQQRVQWRKWVQEEFNRADLAGNGILSVDEFYMYFYAKLCFRFPVMRTGINPGALLFNIFVRYCSIGRGVVGGRNEDMLGHQFAKLCRDAGLVNGKTVTGAAVDIIYHRARAADESLESYKHKAGVAATARMYYPQFLFALDKMAEKRRSGFQEVVARVLSSVETLPEATFADFLIMSNNELEAGAEVPEFLMRPRLLPNNSQALRSLADNEMIRKMKEESQDALKLSTGDTSKPSTTGGLQSFLDSKRAGGEGGGAGGGAGGAATSTAPLQMSVYGNMAAPTLDPEVLRRKEWERPEPSELGRSRAAAASRGVAAVMSADTMHLVRGMDPDQLMASLKRVYESYAAWGGGVDKSALDRRRFSKVLRDAMLVSESGSLPTRKAEAVYSKVLPVSSKALNFIQFIEALRHVALHQRASLNEIMEKLVAVGSPRPGP